MSKILFYKIRTISLQFVLSPYFAHIIEFKLQLRANAKIVHMAPNTGTATSVSYPRVDSWLAFQLRYIHRI